MKTAFAIAAHPDLPGAHAPCPRVRPVQSICPDESNESILGGEGGHSKLPPPQTSLGSLDPSWS